MLKADVSGSLEAFEDEIAKLPQDEVQVHDRALRRRWHHGVRHQPGGGVGRDRASASTSARSARPRQLADREGVEIRTYSVIYRAIDELRDAMQGMLAPETVEDIVGNVEVREIFRASQDRHHRRLHGHRRQGHARREGAPDP